MPSFYWDNVNTAEMVNCNHMLGFTPISWKLRREPKAANNSRTRWQVREGSSPVPTHPQDHGAWGGAEGRGRNPTGNRILATEASAINAFINAMGQRGFWVECDHTEGLMHLL